MDQMECYLDNAAILIQMDLMQAIAVHVVGEHGLENAQIMMEVQF